MLSRPALVVSTLVAALLAGGCVTEGPPPRPAPRPIPTQPTGLIPARMAFSVGNATDTDNNGYLDSVQAVAFIYADSHPISLVLEGSFEFRLNDTKGGLIRRWTFGLDATRAALMFPLPGPAYAFRLGLLDAGTDKVDANLAELTCVFTPASSDPAKPGAAITSGRGHTVQIGRIR